VVLVIVSLAFAWCYVQRIGVQLGIDFTQFDWGAAGFREGDVSNTRVGAGLVYKHGLARGALLFALLAPLAPVLRAWVAKGLLVAELARTAALMSILYFCRHSFWTAMRAMGDAPHALLGVLLAAIVQLVVAAWPGDAREGAPRALPAEP
jgi:hypothetical protein